MKCFYHPEKDAIAICKNCFKAICEDCITEVQNGAACKNSADNCVTEVERLDRFLERSKIMAERTSFAFSRSMIFTGVLGLFFFLIGSVSIILNPIRFWVNSIPLILGVMFLFLTWYSYSESKKYEAIGYEYEDVDADQTAMK